MEPVKLKKAAEECWRNVETKEATLVTDTEITVQADRSRLKQMLENLMRNAVEHSAGGSTEDEVDGDGEADGDRGGSGGVTVTAADIDNGDGFYVADDGPGIPEDEREQVFESGYSTSEEGTGFGLSIVREIAEAHGWEVGVTESRDGGARFEITGVEVQNRA